MVILRSQPVLGEQDDVIAPFGAEAADIVPGDSRSQVEGNVFQTGAIDQNERAHDGRTNCILLGLYLKSLFAVLLDESIAERGIAPSALQAHDRGIQFVIVEGLANHARH